MLFVLTGDVQVGKTRWLERMLEELQAQGIASFGVLAPGVWRDREGADPQDGESPCAARGLDVSAGAGRFEKLGIDNVLLPSGERIPFARRRDLAQAEGDFDPASQSARAMLAWEISESAIERVNEHFAAHATFAGSTCCPRLLVVDELGQLELVRSGGLTEAVACVEAGTSALFPHALVVVRAWLADEAVARFGDQWGGAHTIGPDDEGREAVLAAFCGLAPSNEDTYHKI